MLGTAVVHPFTRHPAINVNSISTVADISNGRTIFGLGAGDSPTTELGFQPSKVSVLRDMIAVSRQLLDGQSVDFRNEAFSLSQARLHWSNGKRIPIYMACSGPRMLALAGEMANGALVLCGAFPEAITYAYERIAAGAKSAGRSVDEIDVWFMLYGSIKNDREEAYAESRSLAAWFSFRAPHYCKLAGFSDSLVDKIKASYTGGEFHLAEEAAKLTPDEMVEKFTVGGTPEQIVERIRSLFHVGVKSVNFFPIGTERTSSIEIFAQQVIPALAPSTSLG
jgi:5,10-methylenetetrahydromethanopterin reductase